MNPNLQQLHAYPFEKLNQLKKGITPIQSKNPIALSIGEPAHPAPSFVYEALGRHLDGIEKYPTTKGIPELRTAISAWISQRFKIQTNNINADTQIIPVGGTREALFSFTQAVVDTSRQSDAVVIMPNPFYQIYEGAAILAGAEPYYLNTTQDSAYLPDFDLVPANIWSRCQLVFICSPGNPSGSVLSKERLKKLINLAEKYDFIIASDECYSEIYAEESNPPQGLLQTAFEMGNTEFNRCVIFQSLSKRSNIPGLRSGFVAGDAKILRQYFQYRTYQGSALPLATQYASIAAWGDEVHVRENRKFYRQKFTAFVDILKNVCTINRPPASFYIWLQTAIDDTDFARMLFEKENVSVLPGSFLSRNANGCNPGKNHVRIALVAPLEECIEAANRIKQFINTLN